MVISRRLKKRSLRCTWTNFGAVLGSSTVTSLWKAHRAWLWVDVRLNGTVNGAMFTLALFLAPLFSDGSRICYRTGTDLVGLFMITAVVKINFDHMTEALPAFLTIVMMPSPSVLHRELFLVCCHTCC